MLVQVKSAMAVDEEIKRAYDEGFKAGMHFASVKQLNVGDVVTINSKFSDDAEYVITNNMTDMVSLVNLNDGTVRITKSRLIPTGNHIELDFLKRMQADSLQE